MHTIVLMYFKQTHKIKHHTYPLSCYDYAYIQQI